MADKRRTTGLHSPNDGRLIAGRYKIMDPEPIGQGGMGVVYLGFDIRTKKQVAIKILHEQFEGRPGVVARFRAETDAVNRVGHEGIAVILDRAQPEESPVFIVMEFLDGKTLAQVLDENGQRSKPLHVQHIRYIGLKLLETMAAVHDSGIIHRDLKPENIFILGPLGKRYRVKIIDFGIAKFREADPNLTQVGTVVGTPLYMSPEQCRGLPIDHRTDLYAIGCVLYEMATGRPPFVGEDLEQIQEAHIRCVAETPSDLNPEAPPELSAVIMTALAKEPDSRFPNAEAMLEALEDAVPEDRMFWRDSRPPSPVNGKPAPRLLPVVTSPPPEESDVTPTRPVRKSDRQSISQAPTITPTVLEQESEGGLKQESGEKDLAGQVREVFDQAVAYLKQAEAWILAPSRRVAVIATGITALVLVSLLILTAILSGGGGSENADAKADAKVATIPEEKTPPKGDQPDVVVIPIPLPLPTPPTPTDLVQAPEEDASGEVAENGEAETATPEPPTPPAGYLELINEAKRARNRRVAVRKLEEATRLWPEGPDAWEALGDVLCLERGQTERARNAFTRALELLPPSALSRRALVEGKLRGLQ
ncbi:MAG: protein kinase domain-containing protein [Patescibacteria group bacterium]